MMMVEARQGERVRALLRARIIFHNPNSPIACTIKNNSTSGATIDLPSCASVPAEVAREVPQRGRTYRARIVWRDASALGVTFVEDTAAKQPVETNLERLKTENRQLKAVVAMLTKRLEDLGQDVSSRG